MYICILPVCITCVLAPHKEQKRGQNPWDWVFRQLGTLWKSSQCSNWWASPRNVFFFLYFKQIARQIATQLSNWSFWATLPTRTLYSSQLDHAQVKTHCPLSCTLLFFLLYLFWLKYNIFVTVIVDKIRPYWKGIKFLVL